MDNNTPLNLNPRAIYPRGSVESVEQEEDNCVNRDKNNVDNKSPQSKPLAANNQESSEDEEEDEESEEMEDSDKEGDRCGTDPWRRELEVARSRQKERKADSVRAALQECSASGRLLDSLSHVTHCTEGPNCSCGVCVSGAYINDSKNGKSQVRRVQRDHRDEVQCHHSALILPSAKSDFRGKMCQLISTLKHSALFNVSSFKQFMSQQCTG